MNRPLALSLLLAATVSVSACAVPSYEPEPTSVYQWQRRQDEIERQYNDRVRLCANTKEDDPRKEENCRGVTGAKQ